MIEQPVRELAQAEALNKTGNFSAAVLALTALQSKSAAVPELSTRLYAALGFAKYRLGDLSGSIADYRQALTLAQEHGTLEQVHIIATSLASCIAHAGDPRSAAESLERLWTLERQKQAPISLQAETASSLGRIYDASKLDFKRARECYTEALKLYDASSLPAAQEEILYHLARLIDVGGEPDAARALYHRYLKALRTSGIANESGVASALRAVSLGDSALVGDEIDLQFRWYITESQVKAEFLRVVGNFFRERASLPDAVLVLQKALFLSASAADTPELVACAKALASVYEDQGEATLALEVIADAIQRLKQIDPANDGLLELSQKLIRKSAKYHNDGFMSQGVVTLHTSSASDGATRRRRLLEACNAAVVFLLQANRNEPAISLIGQALRYGKPYTDDTQHIVGALNFNLAVAHQRSDNVRSALRSIERSADAYEKARRLQDLADTYSFRFRLYYTNGDFPAALEMARKEVKLRQKTADGANEAYADSILELGGILVTLGRDKEAEKVYADFVDQLDQEGAHGAWKSSASVIYVLNNLGYLYLQQRRYDEALVHLDSAIGLLNSVDVDPLIVASVFESKAELSATTKSFAEAADLYRQAIELRNRAGASKDLSTARAQRDLALVLRELKANDEAAEALDAALATFRQLPETDPVEMARLLDLAAYFADSGGSTSEVRTLMAEAASMREIVQQSESLPKNARSRMKRGAPKARLSSTATFLTPDQIAATVVRSPLSRGDRSVRNILLLFSTLKQHTWLVATATKLFCILDDEKARATDRLIQWVQPWESIRSVQVKPYKTKSGLVTIGRRQNWLYSKELHPDPNGLREHILRLRQAEVAPIATALLT